MSLRQCTRTLVRSSPLARSFPSVKQQRSYSRTTPCHAVSSEKMESLSGDKTADKDAELIIPNPKGGNIIFEADAASGVPDYVTRRPIRIYQRSRSATQQGSSKAEKWVISFDVQERWENPLMGWASSHDPVQGVTMEFPDREQAIRFALRQGWEYTVDEPAKAKFRIKTYADNFKYVPGKLRFIKTK